MTMDDSVDRALGALAAADASLHAPQDLERLVLEGFDRRTKRGSMAWSAAHVWTCCVSVAATMAAAVTTIVYFPIADRLVVHPALPEPPVQRVEVAAPRAIPPAALERAARPVVTVPPVAAIWPADDDIVQSMHVRVPRSYLALLGVPVVDPEAEGTMGLEVALAEGGLVRSIRVVR